MPAQKPGSKLDTDLAEPSAKAMIARVQALIDTRPAGTATPLELAVSAYYLGDVTGLACLSLRSEG